MARIKFGGGGGFGRMGPRIEPKLRKPTLIRMKPLFKKLPTMRIKGLAGLRGLK